MSPTFQISINLPTLNDWSWPKISSPRSGTPGVAAACGAPIRTGKTMGSVRTESRYRTFPTTILDEGASAQGMSRELDFLPDVSNDFVEA
jgi:hypothetical protein